MLQNILKSLVIGILCALLAMPAMATTRYVASSANTYSAGSGPCTTTAVPTGSYTTITAATWNSTSESAGDITWICGGVTATAGNTVLTFGWDGANGNPLVMNWDTNAVISAPYFGFGGGVSPNGHSHILLNGGTNGVIKTTANGTNLTYQQANAGIYSYTSGTDLEIENLTVGPIYQIVGQDVANESAWEGTVCIDVDEGYDNVKIHNNNMSYCREGLFDAYTTMTLGQFNNNTIDYSSWMLIVGDGINSSTGSGIQINGNLLGPHFQAFIPADESVHADGIFFFATNPGSSASGQILNNYVHGDMCNGYGNCTGYLFVGSGIVNTTIGNNMWWQDTSGGGPEALVVIRGGCQGENNVNFVNNTLGGYSSGTKTDGGGCSHVVPTNINFENNLFAMTGIAIIAGPTNFNSFSTVDYNDYYNASTVAAYGSDTSPTYFNTLANFQAQTIAGGVHPEAHGNNVNPSFNVAAPPYWISNTTVGTMGVNLSGLGITALDSDAPYTFGTGYACGEAARPAQAGLLARIRSAPLRPASHRPRAHSVLCGTIRRTHVRSRHNS